MSATLLAQAGAAPYVGNVAAVIGLVTMLYLAYKVSGDLFKKEKLEEAREYRNFLTGLPALVAVLLLGAITTISISLTSIFGIGAPIAQMILGVATPVLFAVMFASFLAFVLKLAKMEMKRPGF